MTKIDYKLLRRISGNNIFAGRLISTLERMSGYEHGIAFTNSWDHLTIGDLKFIYNNGVSRILSGSSPFSTYTFYIRSGLGEKAHNTIEKYLEIKGVSFRKNKFKRFNL